MNLMKLAFWRDTKEVAGNTKDENEAVGNVINFPENKDQENKDLEKILLESNFDKNKIDFFKLFFKWAHKCYKNDILFRQNQSRHRRQ